MAEPVTRTTYLLAMAAMVGDIVTSIASLLCFFFGWFTGSFNHDWHTAWLLLMWSWWLKLGSDWLERRATDLNARIDVAA